MFFVGGVIWAGVLANNHLNGTAGIIDRFETVLLDLRISLTGHRPPPEDIVIVAIDDQTVELLGGYPLPRSRIAELVKRIKEAKARVLAMDIVLSAAPDAADDAFLAQTIGGFPTVIAEAGYSEDPQHTAGFVPYLTTLLAPSEIVAEAASVGISNVVTDLGGTPRHVPLLFVTPDGVRPSFGLQALGLFFDATPSVTDTGLRIRQDTYMLDLGWHLALNYYGPSNTIRTVSASSLLEADARAMTFLADSLVIVGVTATAIGERFNTPFDPIMPGVEVQATGIANLVDGSPLVRDVNIRWIDAAVAVALTVVGLAAVAFLPLAPASILYLVLVSAWLIVGTVLFANGQWFNGALPIAASVVPVTGLIIARQVSDRVHARSLLRSREELSRFQSPKLAKRISEDPAFLLTPQQQEACVLFVDLSGYTGLSEQLNASETRDFLKEFHTIIVNVATEESGVVLDFMGDGAFLIFGVPETSRQDSVHAFRCAFHLHRAVTDWLRRSGMQDSIKSVRIGAHLGEVVLSRLGHESQQQITATGDCVNVSSRLLEVAKEFGVSVVVSADLLEALQIVETEPPPVPRYETVPIRGRQQELKVGLWNDTEIAAFAEDLSMNHIV
ncbi:MAG: adenylate/guanylate cyclase domain-containing protein [Pseudomonadota bacterium]